MKKIGIWMDKQKAHIVTLTSDGEKLDTLLSDVEFFNLKSGAPSRTKWGGPQDVVHERKYLEREKHQLKEYFEKLVHAVKDADAIAIFGPADAGEKFKKELVEKHKTLAEKIKTLKKADSMTENQVKALVRDFYKNPK
ncbi:hypothetical protein [Kriegella aquimaris]|uniref:Protein required for attachment to host cells n=1 Tax=Kriegella aquimaris TaxID=192904 RepID=A0A1G9JJ06_9FLAO|nr:hypothetical protein [Kriegella aquimaris]SDL37478.1 hypothetical protein SAMN04488514_101576 [Kriegella aquimaris]